MGNVSAQSEVMKPSNVIQRNKVIKVLMKDFFNKNLTRSARLNGKREANYNQISYPKYLAPYAIEKPANTDEHWKAFKSGEYNLEKEEQLITKLRASIGQRGDEADRLISKLGLVGLENKQRREASMLLKKSQVHNANAPIKVEHRGKVQSIDLNFLNTRGASPTKDMFDSRIDPSLGLSEQASAQVEDSIFNPLNKTLDSQATAE